jgi:putative transposase
VTNTNKPGFWFPPEIIPHAIRLPHRLFHSVQDVEELLAGRRFTVTDETMCRWRWKVGSAYAHQREKRQGRPGDTWHIDEAFVTILGLRQFLWRAVDHDGDTLDILVQRRRYQRTAAWFFHRLFQGRGGRW